MTDTLLEETRLLTSPEAAGILELALTGDPDASVPGFATRLDELHYRPGSEVSAVYTVSYEPAPGDVRVEHLVATTAEVEGAVATLRQGETVLRVWRHPADPRLPGLAPSCDPETVLGWLTAAGIPAPEALHVELLHAVDRPLAGLVVGVERGVGVVVAAHADLALPLVLGAPAALGERALRPPRAGAVIEHVRAVTDLRAATGVLLNHDDGDAGLINLTRTNKRFVLPDGGEASARLIKQEHARLHHESACHRDRLTFATRE